MRNRYPGKCSRCGEWIVEDGGELWRGDDRWEITCDACLNPVDRPTEKRVEKPVVRIAAQIDDVECVTNVIVAEEESAADRRVAIVELERGLKALYLIPADIGNTESDILDIWDRQQATRVALNTVRQADTDAEKSKKQRRAEAKAWQRNGVGALVSRADVPTGAVVRG